MNNNQIMNYGLNWTFLSSIKEISLCNFYYNKIIYYVISYWLLVISMKTSPFRHEIFVTFKKLCAT